MPIPTQAPDVNKPLPAAIEMERVLIGAILTNPTGEYYEAARVQLQASEFIDPRHRAVYECCDDLWASEADLNYTTIFGELSRHGKRELVGDYLFDLTRDMPPVVNIASYIEPIKRASQRRRGIFKAQEITTRLLRDDEDAGQVIASGIEFYREMQAELDLRREAAPTIPTWPEPIREDGFHGVAGELVRLIGPHTEADPAALLMQFLTAWGSLLNRGPHYLAEADHHHTNLYTVIVGTTSKGRKGTSWGRIHNLLSLVDQVWSETCLLHGIGSGEALIDALNHDDHRRLVMESEFARLLAIIAREGTTLSAIFRQCWDTGHADVTVRGKEAHVKGGHLSMIGHVTTTELLRRLSDIEIGNGFGNRIFWPCVKRSKSLPHGGGLVSYGDVPERLRKATDHARRAGNTRFRFDAAGSKLWEDVYPALSEGHPGSRGR
jgi:hypothetical protein